MTDPVPAPRPGAVPAVPTGGDPLRRLVAVMDRLRSPGGCPWDAEQTHASLVPYVLEEAHEVAEAIESGDRAHLREELGDLLLQVVFHARIAQEDPAEPFGIDEVADELVAKLVRRHPHVFADAQVADVDGVHRQWEQIKQAEKARTSALDGVPLALGALARAQKIAARAQRAGLDVTAGLDSAAGLDETAGLDATAALDSVDASVGPDSRGTASGVDTGPGLADGLGERLLAVVLDAERAGVDAEGELRRAARAWEQRLRATEADRGGPTA